MNPGARPLLFLKFRFSTVLPTMWAAIAQSVQRLATVRGSNTGEGEILSTRPDRPWGPHSLLYNGYRVIAGGKAAGAWS